MTGGLDRIGIAVSPERLVLLERFVQRLLEENRAVNLTSVREPAAAWTAHVLDSLGPLRWILLPGPRRLLEVGTGGGAPGIPLAIMMPDSQFVLLESIAKKVRAVERIVADLSLPNVRVLCGRAETLAHVHEHRERFDAVVVRAVAPIAVLLEYCTGFLRIGGHAWLYKTPAAAEDELARSATSAATCQMTHAGTHEYTPAADAGPRVVVAFRKSAAAPRDIPRPPGVAKKSPL